MSLNKKLLAVVESVLAIILLLSMIPSLTLFLRYSIALIGFPYSLDYGEGPVLDQVSKLANFSSIYPSNFDRFPFVVGNYPPLYQLIQVPFYWLFGAEFWYGRIINLISLLSAAIFIALTIHHLTKDRLASLVGGLVLLTIPYIFYWSGFVRVDSLALALIWVALFLVVRWPDNSKSIIFTALFLTGAIYTRQSYGLVAPLTAFVWLWTQNFYIYAIKLTFWTALFSLCIFILLNHWTEEGFYLNVVTANVNLYSWHTVLDHMKSMLINMPYFIMISMIYLIISYRYHHKSFWFVFSYFTASLMTALLIGKAGSNVNYFFELSAAIALTAGLSLALTQSKNSHQIKNLDKYWWLRSIIMVLLVLQMGKLYPWNENYFKEVVYDRVLAQGSDIAKIKKMIEDSSGQVLADEYMGLVVLAGKPLAFQPFEYKQLAEMNFWNEENLLNQISDRKYSLILLYDPGDWDSRGERWTPAQIAAIEKNYLKYGRFAKTIVYMPGKRLEKETKD